MWSQADVRPLAEVPGEGGDRSPARVTAAVRVDVPQAADTVSDTNRRFRTMSSGPSTQLRFVFGSASSLPCRTRTRNGAGDGLRTRYLNLGKVALYRVSYSRSVADPSYRSRLEEGPATAAPPSLSA